MIIYKKIPLKTFFLAQKEPPIQLAVFLNQKQKLLI